VDIGSNDGTWLACYKKFGLRTLGVDGAKNLAEMANARGVETWAKFFNVGVAATSSRKKGRAKLVTAAGVFFHLEELHKRHRGHRRVDPRRRRLLRAGDFPRRNAEAHAIRPGLSRTFDVLDREDA